MKFVIRRVAEKLYDDNEMKRLAETIKQKQTKLFSVVNSETEAQKIVTDLRINGYQAKAQKEGNVWKVYYFNTIPQYKDSVKSKETPNVYANFNKSETLKNLTNKKETYAFDDGAIWHVQEIDGIPCIVKEVSEDDEDVVIRKKTVASCGKKIFKGKLAIAIVQFLVEKNIVVSENLVNEIQDEIISKTVKMPSIQKLIEEFAKKGN